MEGKPINTEKKNSEREYRVVDEVFSESSDPSSVMFLKEIIADCVLDNLRKKGKLR